MDLDLSTLSSHKKESTTDAYHLEEPRSPRQPQSPHSLKLVRLQDMTKMEGGSDSLSIVSMKLNLSSLGKVVGFGSPKTPKTPTDDDISPKRPQSARKHKATRNSVQFDTSSPQRRAQSARGRSKSALQLGKMSKEERRELTPRRKVQSSLGFTPSFVAPSASNVDDEIEHFEERASEVVIEHRNAWCNATFRRLQDHRKYNRDLKRSSAVGGLLLQSRVRVDSFRHSDYVNPIIEVEELKRMCYTLCAYVAHGVNEFPLDEELAGYEGEKCTLGRLFESIHDLAGFEEACEDEKFAASAGELRLKTNQIDLTLAEAIAINDMLTNAERPLRHITRYLEKYYAKKHKKAVEHYGVDTLLAAEFPDSRVKHFYNRLGYKGRLEGVDVACLRSEIPAVAESSGRIWYGANSCLLDVASSLDRDTTYLEEAIKAVGALQLHPELCLQDIKWRSLLKTQTKFGKAKERIGEVVGLLVKRCVERLIDKGIMEDDAAQSILNELGSAVPKIAIKSKDWAMLTQVLKDLDKFVPRSGSRSSR